MVRAGPVTAAALLVLLGIAAPVAGADNSLSVIVLVAEGPHEIGSTLSVRVLVFDYGIPYDVEALTIIVNPSASSREITWARASVGDYFADFELAASDADAFGNIVILAAARIGALEDSGTGFAVLQNFVAVNVAASKDVVAPGENVTVEITVRVAGELADADFVVVSASLGLGASAEVDFVANSRVSVGTYVGTYTVRRSLRQDSLLEISAVAALGPSRSSGSGFVNVEWSDTFEVWYHPVAVTDTSAVFEFWVVGPSALPVPGVLVSATLAYFNTATFRLEVRIVTATTDAFGTARFVLDPLGLTYPILVEGSARLGGKSQSFSGQVWPAVTVLPPGFWAFRRDPLSPLGSPGGSVTYNYTAYLNQLLYASAPLQFLAHTDTEFVAGGEATTDGLGHFTLTLLVQTTVTYVEILTQSDGLSYEYTDLLLPAVRLEATYDEVVIGSRTTITASPPADVPLLAVASITLLNLSAPPWGRYDPSWSRWSGVFSTYTFATVEGDTLSAVVVVPPFLPKNRDYLLAILAYPTAYSTPPPIYMNYWVVRIANLPPTAFARVSNRSLLEGSSIALNASGSSDRDGLVVAYSVDWGDGATSEWSSSPIFQHTYARPGSYVITVFAKDDSGAVAEMIIAVDVHSRLPQTILDVLPILVPIVALVAVAGLVLRRVLLRRPKRPASESRVGEPVPPSESMTTATEPEAKP